MSTCKLKRVSPPCECPIAGFCDRHKVNKGEHWRKLCQTDEKYRQAWDDNTGPGQLVPGIDYFSLTPVDYGAYHKHWREWHTIANPSWVWLLDWIERIPGCVTCKDDMRRWIEVNRPRFDDWTAYSCEGHNHVNRKLLKPELTVEEAKERWKNSSYVYLPNADRQQPSIECVVAVTSIGPKHFEKQLEAVATWKRLGLTVVSVNTSEEIDKLREVFTQVDEWIANDVLGTFYAKPTQPINRLLDVAIAKQKPVLLINSDIRIIGDQSTIVDIVKAGKSAIGIRHNFKDSPTDAIQEVWGLDAFLVWPDQVSKLPEVVFSVGRPMWDYWLGWILGRDKRETEWIGRPYFFHLAHPVAWTNEDCQRGHKHFVSKFGPCNWMAWRQLSPCWNG